MAGHITRCRAWPRQAARPIISIASRRCWRRNPGPDDALRIRYALAKEYEDIGEATPAFRHLAAANAAHKARIGYDFARDAAIFDAIEAGFGQPDFFNGASTSHRHADLHHRHAAHRDDAGRSHPVIAPGCRKAPANCRRCRWRSSNLAGTRSRLVIDPETVQASGGLDPQAIGELYLRRANQHRQRSGGRFIDKLPANFLNIGHIARALPNASIVCLRRHPMDTVWSNYKNLFASTSAYYFYSYDLIDTARYYARFDRLMAFWDMLFPGRILQLSYEALVADQEQQSRRLYAHCGLDLDRCGARLSHPDRRCRDAERRAGAPADQPRRRRPLARPCRCAGAGAGVFRSGRHSHRLSPIPKGPPGETGRPLVRCAPASEAIAAFDARRPAGSARCARNSVR